MARRRSVLFVCMGNICRSPLAEGVFLHKARRREVDRLFRVDSAGTGGWHVGERPDRRALEVAARYGVHLPSRARQVTVDDFASFDHLVCMDRVNERHLIGMGAPRERTSLLLSHDPAATMIEVPDPYSGGPEEFELVYRLVDSACEALLERLLAEEGDVVSRPSAGLG